MTNDYWVSGFIVSIFQTNSGWHAKPPHDSNFYENLYHVTQGSFANNFEELVELLKSRILEKMPQ